MLRRKPLLPAGRTEKEISGHPVLHRIPRNSRRLPRQFQFARPQDPFKKSEGSGCSQMSRQVGADLPVTSTTAPFRMAARQGPAPGFSMRASKAPDSGDEIFKFISLDPRGEKSRPIPYCKFARLQQAQSARVFQFLIMVEIQKFCKLLSKGNGHCSPCDSTVPITRFARMEVRKRIPSVGKAVPSDSCETLAAAQRNIPKTTRIGAGSTALIGVQVHPCLGAAAEKACPTSPPSFPLIPPAADSLKTFKMETPD